MVRILRLKVTACDCDLFVLAWFAWCSLMLNSENEQSDPMPIQQIEGRQKILISQARKKMPIVFCFFFVSCQVLYLKIDFVISENLAIYFIFSPCVCF